MAVKLNQHDLEFILKQIKIAEEHSAGTPLTDLVARPHLPYGLRTVDGSYNNIIPGRELWGAADQTMPRFFEPTWRDDEGDDEFDVNGPYAPGGLITNTDYDSDESVVDVDPRIISNLIVDQTPNNPAALVAALRHAGHEGDLTDEMAAISVPYSLVVAVSQAQYRVDVYAGAVASAQARLDTAEAALEAAELAYGDDPSPENQDAVTAAQASVNSSNSALTGTQGALLGAQGVLNAANGAASVHTDGVVVGAQAVLDSAALALGIEFEVDGKSLTLPNVAPDEGLSAPFNGWMTFFGQFFDHGLDLISKGGSGTIYVPLQPDDPLYVEGSHTNFMVLTRATQFAGPGADGVLGTEDDTEREAINVTTPFVDQNQTYTSHPSHQVFLREYELVDGKPLATGRMLTNRSANEAGEYFGEGSVDRGGLATWAVVKAQARELLGIDLTDRDVFSIPLVRTDLYGEFIRDENGMPQIIIGIGPDGIPNTDDDVLMSGNLADPVKLDPSVGGTEPVRTSHSFLDDIAHNAVPVVDTNGELRPDGIGLEVDPAGNAVQFNPLTGQNLEYDDELLDRHFVTGDGRGNENIGLTAVHHVFHSEHNRQIDANKAFILEVASGGSPEDIAFLNEWLLDPVETGFNPAELRWDGERLFQTARFATEMQYQHLVFEEFGRKVQPLIDLFVFNTITDIDPAIFAEFAHVVYRFGHSMLTEDIARMFLNADGEPIIYDENGVAQTVTNLEDWNQDIGLIEAFLNPIEFDLDGSLTHEQAAGAIFRGMNRVHGNEIDEFVVDALRNNLLGLPLDLASINIARGRDTGMPTLNEARAQLYAASNSTFVRPYDSWADFASNLKTPASVINFIAAYGIHASLEAAGDDMAARRAAATDLVMGTIGEDAAAMAVRLSWLNGPASETGVNEIDLWIGGLAEKKMPFGGMLGSTFNAVFEAQMELLQDLDRFYYLTRTQGLNLLNELENNAFSKLIMANTDMTDPGPDGIRGTADDIVNYHVGVDSFANHDFVLHVDPTKQIGPDPEHDDAALNAVGMTKVQRDNLATAEIETNYIRVLGGEHTVIGGTEEADTIIGDYGDDAIWGGGGNDRIEGGAGVDLIIGGAGDDIITDSGDTGDFIKGEDGDDVIANSNGLDVLMGGDGKDVFLVGVDATEVFGGEGNDFILGGADADFLLGNEGDDWLEGGDGFDVLNGDNSELFFNSTIIGHDVMLAGENENDFDAESGDDIMVQGESVMRNEGMFGFDWAIHQNNRIAADSDMRIPIFTTVEADILRDRFDQTEGLSGWKHNDVLRGDDRGSQEEIELELSLRNHELTQAGVDRIDGLRELLGNTIAARPTGEGVDLEQVTAFAAGNIILGGDGHDTIEGRGGDDFIHGDAWLRVSISIRSLDVDGLVTEDELFRVESMKDAITVNGVTKPLSDFLLAGTIKPRQMQIMREIKYDENPHDNIDTAIFAGNRDWYEITTVGDRTYVARREMEEVDPQIDEGTDTLIGIERIQFADEIYEITETGNIAPVGRLVIDGLPARENSPLTISAASVYEANNPGGLGNVPGITYRWQIERNDGTGDYIDIPNSNGLLTFTPDDEHTGLRIRVLGTYVDAGGVTETVSSLPTDVVIGVNDQPVGELLISDSTPTEGEEITATVAFTDADGITDAFEEGLLSYQWQYSNDGGTTWLDATPEQPTPEFTPAAAHIGAVLQVVVRYTDDLGNLHTVYSAPTAVVGNNQAVLGDNSANGTAGDDFIVAIDPDGDNTLNGFGGNDTLLGGGGTDTLNGGDGNDTLTGGVGDDTVSGGGGDDTIIHHEGDGADTVEGGGGTDSLKYLGTEGDDHLSVVYDGNAIISFEGGSVANVEIVSAEMLDWGTETNGDTLDYGSGSTTGVEVDLLTGRASGFAFIRNVENVVGTAASDTVLGNNDVNRVEGNGGDDTIRGGFGDDLLEGGDGEDRLYGDQGDDTLIGGPSTSATEAGGVIALYDRIDGGAGNDTASYAGAGSVSVDLSLGGPQNTGAAGNDWLISIENLIGSASADTLTGNALANVLDGGTGADLLDGGAGDDTYVIDDVTGIGVDVDRVIETPGGGNDTVRAGVSIDLIAGGFVATSVVQEIENIVLTGTASVNATGNDLDNLLTGNAGNNTLGGSAGTDTVVLDGAFHEHAFAFAPGGAIDVTSAAGGTDRLTGIERLQFGTSVFAISAGTNTANAAVNGTAGADILFGFNNVDTLNGGDGGDILIGGAGSDTLAGGDGDDIYHVEQGADLVDETGSDGIDTIYSTVGRNLNNAAHALGTVENLVLIGADTINGVGNAANNTITGNDAVNTLSGGVGDDILIGNGGNDTLNGGANNDRLSGGAGDDTLNGQGGSGDVAVFDRGVADYAFGVGASGLATVTDMVGGGGTDTLAGIERLEFADGQVLDILTDVADADTIVATSASIIFGQAGNDTITGSDGNDVIIGGAGDDTLFGSDIGEGDNAVTGATDDDTFIWNVGDGFDTINGGFEGAVGDTLVVNGDATNEVYRVYTYDEAVARIGFAGDDENEIVITRQSGTDPEVTIAELADIEEIVVNVGGGANGVELYGDFSLTNLRPETITVIGGTGDDTVDITSLLSAHRIVFRSNGGNDTIVGALRPNDIVELPAGTTLADFEVTIDEGTGIVTLHGEDHSINFTMLSDLPQFSASDGWMGDWHGDDGHQNNDNDNDHEDDDDDDIGGEDNDDDDIETDDDDVGEDADGTAQTGTEGADVLVGTAGPDSLMGLAGSDNIVGGSGEDALRGDEGNDLLSGRGGRDLLFGGKGDDDMLGGAGDDMLYGDEGSDRIFGDDGHDLIDAGSGNDIVHGGAGDDFIIAAQGDGNDTYYGDDLSSCASGNDTLDMAAITAGIEVDLGTGFMGRGSASSSQSGTDTLWGIENVITGSGNDRITASAEVNVMDGGSGNDTFRFLSVADADGDTIMGFQPGDRIDLAGINAGSSDGKFTLVASSGFNAAGALKVGHESVEGQDYTLVQGNVDGGSDAEFTIRIKGHHSLTGTDFDL